jgi:hypothetical protein
MHLYREGSGQGQTPCESAIRSYSFQDGMEGLAQDEFSNESSSSQDLARHDLNVCSITHVHSLSKVWADDPYLGKITHRVAVYGCKPLGLRFEDSKVSSQCVESFPAANIEQQQAMHLVSDTPLYLQSGGCGLSMALLEYPLVQALMTHHH